MIEEVSASESKREGTGDDREKLADKVVNKTARVEPTNATNEEDDEGLMPIAQLQQRLAGTQ